MNRGFTIAFCISAITFLSGLSADLGFGHGGAGCALQSGARSLQRALGSLESGRARLARPGRLIGAHVHVRISVYWISRIDGVGRRGRVPADIRCVVGFIVSRVVAGIAAARAGAVIARAGIRRRPAVGFETTRAAWV